MSSLSTKGIPRKLDNSLMKNDRILRNNNCKGIKNVESEETSEQVS